LLHTYDLPYLLKLISFNLGDFTVLVDLLTASLNDDAQKDWIIKPWFDVEVDRLRELIENANQKILELEQQEQKETGISSLKIRYTGAFGYYIEITKTHYDRIPAHYVRQQTLVGRERFMTPALQQLQYEIVNARTQIQTVEQAVFERVQREVVVYGSALRKLAQALAHLDALAGFARLAYDNSYVRPSFNERRDIVISGGRHPVVEQALTGQFIPNDTELNDQNSLWIITGPNMGGKSTYLRQVALISVMAQCGSFVPANKADLSILDRIFTRIGAGDNVAEGKSTFLVEMEETAIICTQATERSLVILDEVGRGTSTFDGIAIAQAVIEYLYTHVKARCLFATHYHELTSLSQTMPGIVCYHAASTRTKDGIVFLHKMLPGTADGSFGIEVAKLAALPGDIVTRAEQLVQQLAMPGVSQTMQPARQDADPQITAELIQLRKQVAAQDKKLASLDALDWDNLSPKKAFDLLWDLKNK
jgi:DNA mismatch repair protein MutS